MKLSLLAHVLLLSLVSKANAESDIEISSNVALLKETRNLRVPNNVSPVLEESLIDPEDMAAPVPEVEESFIAPDDIADEDFNDKLPGKGYVEKKENNGSRVLTNNQYCGYYKGYYDCKWENNYKYCKEYYYNDKNYKQVSF